MKASGYLWVPIVMAGIFAISIQKNPKPRDAIIFTPEYFKNHTWVSVNEKGTPLTSDYQTCKLVFTDSNEFELRKTFEYSGSTFRIPGKYFMNDSTIQLKNMTDTYTIGEAYIVGDSQLHIKWCRFHPVYGEGTETFLIEASCRRSSNNYQFMGKMLNLLNPD